MSCWATAIGGDGGEEFQHLHRNDSARDKPQLLSKIEVWHRDPQYMDSDGCMQGIRITYQDGSASPVFGTAGGKHASLTLQPGEMVTGLWIATVCGGRRVGQITVTTNRGQVFHHGSKGTHVSHPVSVFSGLVVGIQGRCSTVIDNLGFVFLEKLSRVTVSHERLSTPDPRTITPASFRTIDADNSQWSSMLRLHIDKEISQQNIMSTSEEWTKDLGVPVETTLGVVKITEDDFLPAFSVSRQTVRSGDNREPEDLAWTDLIDVGSGQRRVVDLSYLKGTFEMSYRAHLALHCVDGSVLEWTQPGIAVGLTCGAAKVKARSPAVTGSHLHRSVKGPEKVRVRKVEEKAKREPATAGGTSGSRISINAIRARSRASLGEAVEDRELLEVASEGDCVYLSIG